MKGKNRAFEELISIHASREGSDTMLSNSDAAKYISIHASRKGSDHWRRRLLAEAGISIHASRKGSDGRKEIRRVFSRTFQSTLPTREATSSRR